ncbi:DUF2017 family protein [Leucobacter luti]|uniref:Uncharacterized protein DUF2017 n=1 Tax=Leucobacter luti TaxID=340320 RepID=A0A4Q7TXS4_9MICO|nr:DUF2017 family protein [Leucobacter luti]MBL3698229.1 DUF2017 family protein [Leucobacter luti]RZT64688.1 uncharacterized protein DUF2017 [Leucobacter luti]
MKLMPTPDGLKVTFEYDEAAMLDQLVTQLTQLLQSHSGTALDPDPLFASLEVGGSDELPEDPALARLFPDAYPEDGEASSFRQVTEQGLLNRKLQDAAVVTSALGLGDPPAGPAEPSEPIVIKISPVTLPAWVRTLTALRLAIAARIGLDTTEDREQLLDGDDTRGTVLVFDWLAAIIESVLTIMAATDEDAASDAG